MGLRPDFLCLMLRNNKNISCLLRITMLARAASRSLSAHLEHLLLIHAPLYGVHNLAPVLDVIRALSRQRLFGVSPGTLYNHSLEASGIRPQASNRLNRFNKPIPIPVAVHRLFICRVQTMFALNENVASQTDLAAERQSSTGPRFQPRHDIYFSK